MRATRCSTRAEMRFPFPPRIRAVRGCSLLSPPTDPTRLSLPLQDASTVQLWFGSLGTRDWDGQVAVRGALLTALWQYGVPSIFLIVGAKLKEAAAFNRLVNDRELQGNILSVLARLALPTFAAAEALHEVKKLLAAAGDFAASVLLKKGLEAVAQWIAGQIAVEQIA